MSSALRVEWDSINLFGAVRLAADPAGPANEDVRIVWVRYRDCEPRAPGDRWLDELSTAPEFAEAVAAASPAGFRPERIRAFGALVPVRLAPLAPARLAVVARGLARSHRGAATSHCGAATSHHGAAMSNHGAAMSYGSTYRAAAPTAGARAGDERLACELQCSDAAFKVRGWLAEAVVDETFTQIVVTRTRDSADESSCWVATIYRGATGEKHPHTSWLVTDSAAHSPIPRRTARRTVTRLMWPGGAALLRAAAAAALGRRARAACRCVAGLG